MTDNGDQVDRIEDSVVLYGLSQLEMEALRKKGEIKEIKKNLESDSSINPLVKTHLFYTLNGGTVLAHLLKYSKSGYKVHIVGSDVITTLSYDNYVMVTEDEGFGPLDC